MIDDFFIAKPDFAEAFRATAVGRNVKSVALSCGQFSNFWIETDGRSRASVKGVEYDKDADCLVVRVRFECVDHPDAKEPANG